MSTSSEAAKAQLVKTLRDDEELHFALSKTDAVELSKKMFQKNIISDDMMDRFSLLDHSRVESQLQVRYLLRLFSSKIEEDESVKGKFLDLLSSMGETQLCEYLKENSTAGVKPTEILPESSDIPLCEEDVGCLLEVLVSVSHKWELIGRALGLPMHEIENCRRVDVDNRVSFSHVLSCWLTKDTTESPKHNLHNLKKVLQSELVAEGREAKSLEEKFRKANKNKTHSCTTAVDSENNGINITHQSLDIKVADGHSTLLLVQANRRESLSYQWKKNDQSLTNDRTYSGVNEDILIVSHACQGTEGKYTCCVSDQETEVCSNKINLTVLYPSAKKQLLNLYSAHREVPLDSWPPVGTETFINLVLTRSSTDLSDRNNYSVHENIDELEKTKDTVEYREIFSEYRPVELILVEGRPGSGKTTLVQKLVKDWSQGKTLHKANLVFLVTLRNVSHDSREESLSRVLRLLYNNKEELQKVCTDVERDGGEGVCFILDGLDEYSPVDSRKSVIYKLLHKTYLPRAMIIVSSRPVATEALLLQTLTLKLETVGFTKKNILKYVDNFPFNTSSSRSNAVIIDPNKLKEYLHAHPNVFDMCYLPVHAAMICFLYKYLKGDIPYTQTKIYEEFTKSMILRHLKRSNEDLKKITSLQELDGSIKGHFITLCHLAYNMTTKNKQVVTLDEVGLQLPVNTAHDDRWSLGLVTVNHVAELSGTDKTYTFLHLTFQEFLTAFYINTLEQKEQREITKKFFQGIGYSNLFTVLTFYSGLVDYEHNTELMHHLDQLNYNTIIHCVFESQHPRLCVDFVLNRKGKIILKNYFMTPSDRTALVYIISKSYQHITNLDVEICDDTTLFLQQICCHNFNNLTSLTILEDIVDAGMQFLARLLRSSPSLEFAAFKFEKVSPKGFQYVADSLKELTSLNCFQFFNGQSCSGISVLLSGLQFNKTDFGLSFRFLDTAGVVEVCRGFVFLTDILSSLILSCKERLGPEGAAALANGLPTLAKLRNLRLSYENVDSGGVIPFASRLHDLAYLSRLTLSDDIDPIGVMALTDSMHSLTNLLHLDLSQNNIGSDGCAALANGIQCLTNLSYLDLSHNNMGSDGCSALAKGIQSLTKLTHLKLYSNHIGPAGVAALADVLHCIKKLVILNLSDNEIGSEGAMALARELSHLTELWDLDLSINDINLHSALSVIQATKSSSLKSFNLMNEKRCHWGGAIAVTGLVSPDDNVAISNLKAAAQHDTEDRKLDIRLQIIHVPSKRSIQIAMSEDLCKEQKTSKTSDMKCTLL